MMGRRINECGSKEPDENQSLGVLGEHFESSQSLRFTERKGRPAEGTGLSEFTEGAAAVGDKRLVC